MSVRAWADVGVPGRTVECACKICTCSATSRGTRPIDPPRAIAVHRATTIVVRSFLGRASRFYNVGYRCTHDATRNGSGLSRVDGRRAVGTRRNPPVKWHRLRTFSVAIRRARAPTPDSGRAHAWLSNGAWFVNCPTWSRAPPRDGKPYHGGESTRRGRYSRGVIVYVTRMTRWRARWVYIGKKHFTIEKYSKSVSNTLIALIM